LIRDLFSRYVFFLIDESETLVRFLECLDDLKFDRFRYLKMLGGVIIMPANSSVLEGTDL
jgi:hypothetical protein